MTQLFNVSVNGVDVTGRHDQTIISEEVNRFYDVATVIIDASQEEDLEVAVVINYGTKTFNGFVYSVAKVGKDKQRLECRSNSAKLTEPYSPYETVMDNATTSAELVALYQTKTGITISLTSQVLDFGGSYERSGTLLNALTNIANITGAEYYYDPEADTVKIVPNAGISIHGTEVPEDDIFDFTQKNKTVYNKGVGTVIIKSGSTLTDDILSSNKIYAEIDECSAEVYFYTNPFGPLEHTVGMGSLTSTTIIRKEEHNLLDNDLVRLDGAIKEIDTITLNGAEITNYNIQQGHNVIYFSTLQRGTLSVTYTAYAHKGYLNVTGTPVGRFISFDAYYLDQVIKFQGFLSEDCFLNTLSDGDMDCIVPRDLMYPKGFDVWTIGGDPEFTFYQNNLIIPREVTTTVENYIAVEDVRLEPLDAGGFRYRTRYPIGTALGARSAGIDVSYTTGSDVDGFYFDFDIYYPLLVVSYNLPASKHHVIFPDIVGATVSMVITNLNTGETCEHELEGINNDDYSAIPCELNQWIPVNVSSELGVPVASVAGQLLEWQSPDFSTDTGTVDSFGIIKIWVYMDGNYVLDTSSIVNRTSITLISNVNG